jgi:hypothetical protein
MMQGWNYTRRLIPVIRLPPKLKPTPRVQKVVGVGVAVIASLGLLTAFWFAGHRPPEVQAEEPVADASRIAGPDAHLIPRSRAWNLAQPKDFGLSFASFVGISPEQLVGKVAITWTKNGSGNLYVLTNGSGQLRVVLVYKNKVVLDRGGAQILGGMRVPHETLTNAEWKPDADPKVSADGDGVLVLVKDGSEMSPQIAFSSEGMTYVGILAEISKVDLRAGTASDQP